MKCYFLNNFEILEIRKKIENYLKSNIYD